VKNDLKWLSPGLTGKGKYKVNFGDREFKFAPPNDKY